ncbi:MAG: SagB family peptide dehydrogenase [Pseudonocardia sp.]|nr:SagB family peptide dehydrogenase [Pseudonocardia sp.]
MGDLQVAQQYWTDTLLDPGTLLREVGEEGSPSEPPKFKCYSGRPRQVLPQQLPLTLGRIGDVLCGGLGEPAVPLTTGDATNADVLGALLFYGYGFSREDVGPHRRWPHHRIVPSARCFYPTELYVCVSDRGAFPPGVYHYDQLHHALVELRPGDHGGVVSAAIGSGNGADVALVLTSHLWKTAFRYRHYAYRLCCQEAGMVAGNLQLVARALGLVARVHHQFLDSAIDHLLGLVSGDERTFAVLPLHPAADPDGGSGAGVRSGTAVTAGELCSTVPALALPFLDVPKDLASAGRTYQLDALSTLGSTEELRAPAPTPVSTTTAAGTEVPPVGAGPDLAATLRERTSGGGRFRPVPGAIDATVLTWITRFATGPAATDLGCGPLAQVYLVVLHVSGVPAGVYRCEGGVLRRCGGLPPGGIGDEVMTGTTVMDVSTVNVFCYIVQDRRHLTRWLGNRGYRTAHVDAGIVAQRICVLAAASGLAARPTNSYLVPGIQRLLGIADPEQTPLFQIALGRRTSGAQYEMGIVF